MASPNAELARTNYVLASPKPARIFVPVYQMLFFFGVFEVQNCKIFFKIPMFHRNWIVSLSDIFFMFYYFFSKLNLGPSQKIVG